MPMNVFESLDLRKKRFLEIGTYEDDFKLDQAWEYFRVSHVWSSNALEGNAYSILDVKILLEDGLTTNGKLDDAVDVEGLGRSYGHVFDLFRKERENARLDAARVAALHERLTKGLRVIPHAGVYREGKDASGLGAQEAVQALLEGAYSGDRHPICQAAMLCLGLERIQPFKDKNGLVARAAATLPLLCGHYLPLVVEEEWQKPYKQALAKDSLEDMTKVVACCVEKSLKLWTRIMHE